MTKLMKLNIQMFASGTIDGSSTATNCDCRIVWSSTLNAETNTSSVSESIQVYKSGTGTTTGTFSGNITIDGTSQGVSKYGSWSWGTWHTVGSYTKTVTHNDNGTKAITISGSLTQTGTSMAGTYSASGTATLDTNNRASILGDIANFGINDTADIPITKYVAGYTDSLVITYGATTIKTINSITNGYDLTFSSGEKTTILGLMTSPQISLKFTLTTKDGATQIGSSSVKYVTVTSLDKPVLYNIKKKTNGHYKVAINGIVDDDDVDPLQIYDDSGDKIPISGGGGGGGDMLKSVYDTNNNGSVDKADRIKDIDIAGNNKYYGTNAIGTDGFYSLPAEQIQSDWNQTNNALKDYIKNKPTIPVAQIQSDWNQDDDSAKDYIKNKPEVVNGTDGTDGEDGVGVPTGGTAGQVLAKATSTDYDTSWIDPPSGGGMVLNIDGGYPDSNYSGIDILDGGDV